MNLILILSIILATFLFMEFVAWSVHKYIMHGFLWYLHKDHHQVDKNKILQKNDAFFLIFAIPSAILIIYGIENFSYQLYIGIGIALYGLAYFVVHEIIIHQRVKILSRIDNKYIRAIRFAHKVHHKKLEKENSDSFGMLLVSFKYFK
ncbi:MAG: beta-carotene hydroxylase [Flavobacteriales bacterium]|nr:beta-carotene hydroxylase [Flavobacteriales bacterium]MDC0909368.1 sterol desaturase family protein [Flavobacteriales bacterium]